MAAMTFTVGGAAAFAPDAEGFPRGVLKEAEPFVRRSPTGLMELDLLVRGARCASCLNKIETAMRALPGVVSARLNLGSGRLMIAWRGEGLAAARIPARLAELGYEAEAFDPDADRRGVDEEGRRLMRCLAVAGFATLNIMMLLSIPIWFSSAAEMGEGVRGLFHWFSALIALAAVAYSGRPFFQSALKAVQAGHANMDVPISLGVLLALGVSLYETIAGGRHAFYDAAVMLLFFLLIGRLLDHRLRDRARSAAKDLLALQSLTARRIGEDGHAKLIKARDIEPGDLLLLAPGDRAPVDGTIMDGRSEIDVSLVTGESLPQNAAPGTHIHAGMLNLTGALTLRAAARAETSLIAELSRLVEIGQQAKAQYVRLADRAAALYVPVVHALALATLIGWWLFGDAGLRQAILTAAAVLIITCPCALGLAVPAVQIVATGRLFRRGVLVKAGDALERLAEIDMVVFDKTGTLTSGKPRLLPDAVIDKEAIGVAAQLARASRHPLSEALAAAAGPGPIAANIREKAGEGLEGIAGGLPCRLGRAAFAGVEAGAGSAASEMWLTREGRPPVRFRFEDRLRSDAVEVVGALRDRGLDIVMLSGDREEPAKQMAAELGITRWHAAMSPADKVAFLAAQKAAGKRVLMIGDGLNDAPSLAQAHVSMSPASAADASQAAADFVLQGALLAPILTAIDTARKSRRRVLENFGIAIVYNALAIPIAVAGFVTPLIAAAAMSGSSILVTLNALRLESGGRRS